MLGYLLPTVLLKPAASCGTVGHRIHLLPFHREKLKFKLGSANIPEIPMNLYFWRLWCHAQTKILPFLYFELPYLHFVQQSSFPGLVFNCITCILIKMLGNWWYVNCFFHLMLNKEAFSEGKMRYKCKIFTPGKYLLHQ